MDRRRTGFITSSLGRNNNLEIIKLINKAQKSAFDNNTQLN